MLATQHAPDRARLVVMDGTAVDSPLAGELSKAKGILPHEVSMVNYREVQDVLGVLGGDLVRLSPSGLEVRVRLATPPPLSRTLRLDVKSDGLELDAFAPTFLCWGAPMPPWPPSPPSLPSAGASATAAWVASAGSAASAAA